MDEEKRKPLMIGIIVACLVSAAGIFYVTNKGSSAPTRNTSPRQMLCINEDCGAEFEFSSEEFREQMTQMARPPMRMMAPTFICPECEQESAVLALKCAECGTVFIAGEAEDPRYSDRCPNCDYSAYEARRATTD